MSADALRILNEPAGPARRMVIALSGWMDGGDVSTGTVEHLVDNLGARRLAEIDPEPFYIYNFPGSMEISALFRPHTRIEDGRITVYQPPVNLFHHAAAEGLVLFRGKEPNLHWRDYGECLFAVVELLGVETIYFVGSVAGAVPHSRQPRLHASVSAAALQEPLEALGIRPSNYEGPASVVTYLTVEAARRGVAMTSLVAEIPAYIRGENPIAIESITRRLAALLDLQLDLTELEQTRAAFEERLDEMVAGHEDLAALIQKMESEYDNEVFDTQMGDLRSWLEEKGVRLD